MEMISNISVLLLGKKFSFFLDYFDVKDDFSNINLI
jgi:hypothetical protein